MAGSFDVVVVGAGVVGVTVAYELTRAGATVALLDRAAAVAQGCSYANAGLVAPRHVGPLATPRLLREAARQMLRQPPAVRIVPDPSQAAWLARLALSARPSRSRPLARRLQELAARSAAMHERYQQEGIQPSYRKTGALEIRRRRAGKDQELLPHPVSRLGPSVAATHEVTYVPDEAVVDSRAYSQWICREAQQRGLQLHLGCTVDTVVVDAGRVRGVRAGHRTWHADQVVLAGGLHTRALAEAVGVNLPLRGGRGYIVDLEVQRPPSVPIRFPEHRLVLTPFEDRLRVCGLMEFGPEGRPMSGHVAARMTEVVSEALPELGRCIPIDVRTGERPCTPDGAPVIGRSSLREGLVVAAGHGMWGLVLAPVTGQLVSSLCSGSAAAEGDMLFRPDRFTKGSA